MPFIDVLENQIFYEADLKGSVSASLVFIHGSGGDCKKWSMQMDGLSKKFALYALDLPGHGLSGGEPCFEIDDYAKTVVEFILRAGISRPVFLVGHSMGAAIALTIGLEQPELVDGLILIGGGARMRVAPDFLKRLAEKNLNLDFFRMGFSSKSDPQLIEKTIVEASVIPVNTFFADFSACDRFDVRKEVDKLKVPTLLIVGEEDRLTPIKLSQFIRQETGCEMVCLAGAGHFVMQEKSNEVNAIIEQFVSGRKAE